MGKEPKNGAQEQRDHREPQELNIGKFADARATELLRFEETLKNKFRDTTRTPMQSVPKHMRRRAMSHNRFRVPSRIRQLNAKFMRDSEKHVLKCRKHGRNSKVLMLHYLKRVLPTPSFQQGKKWLETHLFHARRMQMEIYCGFKIAYKSRVKQIRRTYALSQNGSVIYDKSYYTVIDIQGTPGFRIESLLNCLGCSLTTASGKQTGQFDMDCNGLQLQAVLVSESRALVIGVTCLHDYIVDRIDALIKRSFADSCEAYDLTGMVNIFEMIGPSSGIVLAKAIGPICVDDHKNQKLAFLEKYVPMYQPINKATTLDLQHSPQRVISARQDKAPDSSSMQEEKSGLPSNYVSASLAPLLGLACHSGLENIEASLLVENKAAYLLRFIETRRGQYSHKRTKKPVLLEEPPAEAKPSTDNNQPADPRVTHQMQEEPIKQQNRPAPKTKPNDRAKQSLEAAKSAQNSPFRLTILNTSDRSKCLNRYVLICPLGFGKVLFRRLTIHEARAMGRVEYEHVLHQFGLKVFPRDFPESSAFYESESISSSFAIDRHRRRPPQKRPNFLKLGSPSPFECNFGLIDAVAALRSEGVARTDAHCLQALHSRLHSPMDASRYTSVLLKPLFRTPPADLAYLAFPTVEDLKLLLNRYCVQPPTAGAARGRQTPGSRVVEQILNPKTLVLAEGKHELHEFDSGIALLGPKPAYPGADLLHPSEESPPAVKSRDLREALIENSSLAPQVWCKAERNVIGRVTSGFRHFSKSCGFGFAHVLTAQLEQLQQITSHLRTLEGAKHLKLGEASVIVLYRNTTSQYYHFGLVERHD